MAGFTPQALDEFKANIQRKLWTRPVACQNQCHPPDNSRETCSCQRDVVHVNALKQWWQRKATGDSSQTNLQRVLQEIPLVKPLFYPLSPEKFTGDRSCLMVLSLLLSQDRANFINIFSDSGIIDKHLGIDRVDSDQTLRSNLRAEMQSSEVETMLNDFQQKRWEYCPLELTLHMSESLHGTRVIPPFCHKILKSDKGATASIYWVAVQKDFITDPGLKCALEKSLYKDDDHGECYQMILKTYCGNKKTVYELERAAFGGLASNDEVPIVSYLGCYTHDYGEGSALDRTYNLLLEHCERDLMQDWADETKVPPVLAEEIIRFWKSLFEVAKAIRHVHGFELLQHGSKAPLKYVGWHADIKPDNILVTRGRMKLADFGYSKIARAAQQQIGSVPREMMHGFTDTYGAPEISSMKLPDGTMSAVTQSIDTWSFGCVLSVAATWVVLGFQGVRQFGELRQISPFSENDRFHNGIDVLPDVRKWHNFLRGHMRYSDTATMSVLDLVENHMLQSDPANRIEPEELCTTLQNILEEATTKVNALRPYSRETDPTVLQALFSIEKQALHEEYIKRNTTSISMLEYNTLSPPDRARMQDQKNLIMKSQPLAQTPYRREILEEELQTNAVIQDAEVTDSPKHALLPRDGLAGTSPNIRKPKRRNPDYHPVAFEDNTTATNEAAPTSSYHPDRKGKGRQPSQRETAPAVTSPPAFDIQGYSTSPELIYSSNGHVSTRKNNTIFPPGPTALLTRPTLTLETPKHSPAAIDAVPTFSPLSMPDDFDDSQHFETHNHQYDQYADTPTLKGVMHTSSEMEGPWQDKSAYRHTDSSHWQNSSQWHAEGLEDGAMSHPARSISHHGHGINPQLAFSNPSALATTTTPSRWSVLPVSTSGILPREPLPESIYGLSYDVCQVRKKLDGDTRMGKVARMKGFIGKEERKPDPDLAEIYGQGREIIFVVDNGATMLEHWPIVVFVAETMVKKAAGLDKDGVDLKFTVDGKKHDKSRLRSDSGRKEFRAALVAAEPENSNGRDYQTDMHTTLDQIAQKWAASDRPDTTVLVLTDGKWVNTMDNLVDNTILEISGKMREGHAGSRSFSIQFIRFGEECADKLARLDDDLCRGSTRDIVDHCSWRSTVDKMFKGSIRGGHDEDDPEEVSITFDYKGLVNLFRSFNNNFHQDRITPTSTLSPPSSSRYSLSRSSSRGSNTDTPQRKRESAPTVSFGSWQQGHTRAPWSG